MTVTNGTIIGNTISDILGIHANGMSIYSSSSNIVVEKNIIKNSGSLFTFEQSSNLLVRNNLFDGYDFGTINEWSGMSGYVYFINNTMVNGDGISIIKFLGSNPTPNRVLINNVIDGYYAGATTHKYNIYTMSPGVLGEGESLITDMTQLFVNPSARDYHPLNGGPLINKGADVSAYGVFQDIQGTTRPQGPAWDIGAYEATTDLKKLSPPQPKLL
jgi:hypothetical protein